MLKNFLLLIFKGHKDRQSEKLLVGINKDKKVFNYVDEQYNNTEKQLSSNSENIVEPIRGCLQRNALLHDTNGEWKLANI